MASITTNVLSQGFRGSFSSPYDCLMDGEQKVAAQSQVFSGTSHGRWLLVAFLASAVCVSSLQSVNVLMDLASYKAVRVVCAGLLCSYFNFF